MYKRNKNNKYFSNLEIITPTSKEKKPSAKKKIPLILIIFLILIGLAWSVFYSPFFKIRNINIEGILPNADLAAEIDGLKGKNIFLISLPDEEKKLILKQPEIKILSIWRGLPDTIKLKMQLRDKVLIWQSQDNYYYIDDQGYVFKERGPIAQDENVILIVDSRNMMVKLGAKILSPYFIQFVQKLSLDLPSQNGIKITSLSVEETTFQITAQTSENFKILFDTTRPLDSQLQAVKKVLTDHRSEVSEYIDVRVNGWVYYK